MSAEDWYLNDYEYGDVEYGEADDPIPFPIQPKEERQYDAKKIFNYLKIVRSICNSCNECSKCMFWKEHELYGECILADRNPCDWEVSE